MIRLKNVNNGKVFEGQIVCDGGHLEFAYFDDGYWSSCSLMYMDKPLWVPAESEDA